MAACPSCQQNVEDDFGMVTCQHCGHVFLIDFEGEVESSQSEAPTEEPPPAGEDVLYALHEDDALSETGEPLGEQGFDPPLEDGALFSVGEPEVVEAAGAGPEEDLFESTLEDMSPVETKTLAEEISEFAESQSSPEGLYQYRIKIKVEDAQDILQNLRQAIEDLGLADSKIQRLDSGALALDWMGAVSAHRLVRRLRPLGLEIEWDQRHSLKESD